MTDLVRNKGEKHLHSDIFQWEKRVEFDILNYTSDHGTLVQLFDTAGSINSVVSITGCWIYDFNYKLAIPLIK